MADHHEAKDGSRRNTYRHSLGRPLHPDNAGQLQWGPAYREFHQAAWAEVRRVLAPGGEMLLNVSDHIRGGDVMLVSQWHLQTFLDLRFRLTTHVRVATPRLRYGANHHLRVDHENLFILRKPE